MGCRRDGPGSATRVGPTGTQPTETADEPHPFRDRHEMKDTLHRRIRIATERNPDALGLVTSEETLTYEALEDRSSRLAFVLRSVGCRPSDRIGVLMDDSTHAVAALLGVLKAGCAYVPLDPDAPVPETAEVIRRTEPRVLLIRGCTPDLRDGLRARRLLEGLRVGWLDVDEPPFEATFTMGDLEDAPSRPPDPSTRPDDLAYVLSTSPRRGHGTSIPVTHGDAGAFVDWAISSFELGPDDRVFGHRPFTLHHSAFDVFATLAAGASVHQAPGRGTLHPHHDPAFIESHRITAWLTLSSRLSHVARFDGLEGHDLSSLRRLAWCGDPLRTPALRYWSDHLPETMLTSLYGSPASVVGCGVHRPPGGPGHAEDRVRVLRTEEAVMQLDGVLDCAVVSVVAADGGARIGCAYIPEGGEPIRTGDLEKALGGRLASRELPELWLVVDDLPVDHLGRIDRHLIARMFGGITGADPGPAPEGPRSPVRRRRA